MAQGYNPSVSSRNLVWAVDGGNQKSYPGSGNTWFDLTRKGTNGTLFSNPSFNSGLLRFNGTSNFADFTFTHANETDWYAESFTLGGFARQTQADTADDWLFDLDYVGYRIWGGNNIPFMVRGPSASWSTSTAYPFVINQWHYVVATMIDNGSANNVNVYIDGELYSTHTFGEKNIGADDRANGYFRIAGHHVSSRYRAFDIGFLHKNNTILTADEIKQNYQALRGRFT